MTKMIELVNTALKELNFNVFKLEERQNMLNRI